VQQKKEAYECARRYDVDKIKAESVKAMMETVARVIETVSAKGGI
jgi:hypothetical protein